MSWSWFISAAIALVAGAIAFELWVRRGTKPPLSSHAVNQRRWDDPDRPGQSEPEHLMTAEHAVGRFGLTGKREWRVAKDPQEQARILMPAKVDRNASANGKGNDND